MVWASRVVVLSHVENQSNESNSSRSDAMPFPVRRVAANDAILPSRRKELASKRKTDTWCDKAHRSSLLIVVTEQLL